MVFGPRPHAGAPGSGSFADLPLGPLPERVDEAVEPDSGCVGVGGRGQEELADHRLCGARSQAEHRVVRRHVPPAENLQVFISG